MVKLGLTIVLVGFLQVFAALNVELTVKECAGVGAQGYPIRTVVPIKAGLYQDVNSFRLTDGSGNTVPAQFEVLSRRYLGDKSITNIAVLYEPSVLAYTSTGTGTAKYYLKDDGTGNSTGTGLSVSDVGGVITVQTGNMLKFTVKKTGFNILDQVWYDPNNGGDFSSGNLVVKSNAQGGGEFIGRFGSQLDASRSDLLVEVEEAGPIEVVIRVEALTKYNSPSSHTHGWAVRIYAYAGKPFIRIDYQLQNSSKVKKLGWPLYFHAMNLNFDLNLSGTVNVKAGLGNGNSYSAGLGNGVCLAQRKDSLFNIYRVDGVGDTTTVLASGGRPDGYVDIDNGTVGVTVQTRNFWRMWPNGIKVDANQKLQVQLFPEWSCQINSPTKNPVFNTTHLYWLADMQHVYKEVYLNFHGVTTANAISALSKTIEYHPVASMPVAYVSAAGSSLDLEGLIANPTKLTGADVRVPVEPGSGSLGWYYFLLNGRRTGTAAGGGYPPGGGQFWASENPSDWFTSERWAIGEMNIRPQWMAQYNFKTDYSLLHLGMNECGGIIPSSFAPMTWRVLNCGSDQIDTAVLSGTGGMVGIFAGDYCSSIDDAHYWHDHIRDSYWITGNPWQRDYYKYIVEHRKNQAAEFPSMSRFGGHPLADALNAFLTTGDTAMGRMLKDNMLFNRNRVRPQFGDYSALCCGSFGAASWQLGFGARAIIDYMAQVRDHDTQAWAEAFQLFSGYMYWNLTYGNFGYYNWAPEKACSYYGSFTLLDPQAWYYWNTGKSAFKNQIMDYITTGITVPNPTGEKGTKPMTADGSTSWTGDYAGRWVQFIRQNSKTDSIPPVAVTDLNLTRSGTQCTIEWTVPAGAKRCHIVWGTKPISEISTDNVKYLNWWNAKTVGKKLTAASGTKDQTTFTVPDTGLLYASVFTWDSSMNMSAMSNLGKSDATPPSAPGNLTVQVVNAQTATLTWTASSDAESGVWNYNIYRNGVLIATTDQLTFTDKVLFENTAYTYSVAAYSGSCTEGAKSEQSITTPVDVLPPSVVSITSVGNAPEIVVVFAENLDSVSAKAVSHYSVNKGIAVENAVLSADRRQVTLTCDTLLPDTAYLLTINGVKDISIAANVLNGAALPFVHKGPLSITNTKPLEYVWDVFSTSIDVFIDQSTKLETIPLSFQGLPLLRCGSYASKYYARSDSIICFTSNKSLLVYVFMDPSQQSPSWLTSKFTRSGDTISGWIVWQRPYAAGRVQIPGGGLNEQWSNFFVVVRPMDSSWVAVEEGADSSAFYTENVSVYPNPFNPQVSISVQGPNLWRSGQHLPEIRILDIQGRLVAVLAPSLVKTVGHSARFEYQWNASTCASGAYLADIRANGKTWKKRMTLLK